MESSDVPRAPDRRPAALLLCLLLLYAGCGLSGYGNDNDTYGMLKTWADLREHGAYFPSRSPGFPLPEMLIGAASEAAGHAGSNLLSAVLACAALFCFHRLLLPWGAGRALWATAAAGLNPAWVIAASSSMDYVYGMAFFLAGLLALRAAHREAHWVANLGAERKAKLEADREKPGSPRAPRPYLFLAALAFAAASASRLTYAPAAALAYGAAALIPAAGGREPPPRARLAASAALCLALSILAYLPSYLATGASMFRPTFAAREVGFFGLDGLPSAGAYLSRFLYRNLALWGIPAALVLLAGLASAPALRRPRTWPMPWPAAAAGLAALLFFEAVFARLPLETAYLLPVLFLVLTLAAALPAHRGLLPALALCLALQNLVAIDVLDRRGAARAGGFLEASGSSFRPRIRAGDLVEDLRARPESQAAEMEAYFGARGYP